VFAARGANSSLAPIVTAALDPDTYDYEGAVLWNRHAPALWNRFTVELVRVLAGAHGLSEAACRRLVRVAYRSRQARADYRAAQDEQGDEDDDSTPVMASWTFVGSGYLNPGDVLLAAGVEASLRAAREALLDLRQRPQDD